jgi:hypothetical protein
LIQRRHFRSHGVGYKEIGVRGNTDGDFFLIDGRVAGLVQSLPLSEVDIVIDLAIGIVDERLASPQRRQTHNGKCTSDPE